MAESHRSELFERIADTVPDVLYLFDLAERRVTYVNHKVESVLGRTAAQFLALGGGLIDALVHPDDAATVRADLTRYDALREGEAIEREFRLRHADGSYRWFAHRCVVFARAADGRATQVLGAARDITGRRTAEAALRENEERFHTLADSIPQLAWMADSDGWIFWYNRRWYDYTGTTFEEMEGWGWQKLHHPAHLDRVVDRIKRSWRTGEPWEDTFPLRGKDGSYRWFLSRALPIRDAAGRVVRWFGTNTDVTEQREADAALRESEERFRVTFASAPVGIASIDRDGRFFDVNPRYCEITGYAREELIGRPFAAITHPDDVAENLGRYERLFAGEIPSYRLEKRYLRGDGGVVWIDLVVTPVRDAAGRIVRAIGIVQDVTDAKEVREALAHANEDLELRVGERTRELAEANERLRRSEAFYSALFEHSPNTIFVLEVRDDGSFVYERMNAGFHAATGVAAETIIGKRPEEAYGPVVGAELARHYRLCVATRRPVEHEIEIAYPNGSMVRRPALVPLFDEAGRVTRIFGTTTDLTEARRTEEQLRQAQKMQAVGQLAGGIAHDFNNLLTAVSGNLELLDAHVAGDTGRRLLRSAMRAAERGGRLTGQLLAFSRRQDLQPKRLELNRLVGDMGELLARTLGGTVRVATRLADGLWPALGDATQLELAVLNLAINGRDAMPEGGVLTIATRNVALNRPAGDLPAGDYVVLSVADAGGGMSEDVRRRAFEPFFTTKEPGRGTGLGLAQVYGVAHQLGGSARIESRPGKGTTVELWLPRAVGGVDEAAAGAEAATAAHALATVLVVDDDGDVREFAAAGLRSLGYRVLEAENGLAALALLDGRGDVDLLLADFAMPGMNGAELARRVGARRPPVPVLIMTGYADAAALKTANLAVQPLRKPFRLVDLDRRVAETLARRTERRGRRTAPAPAGPGGG